MSLPGKTMKVGGYNYHVSDQGDGDKVALLLHGMPDSSSCWKYQVPVLLDAGFRVVVPDTLGYGKTDKPQEVEAYTADQIAAHILEIIEQLGLKDIYLVGHDWGSALGWALVLECPELFKKYLSLSVGHLKCFIGQAFEQSLRAIPAVSDNWYMYLNTQPEAAELYMHNNCEFYRNVMMCTHPEVDEVCKTMSDPINMNAMLNYDKANTVASWYLEQIKGDAPMPNCQVPTMVVYPEQDMFLWKEQAIETPKYMDAECRIELMQGGHWAMLDHPDDFNRLMLDWLK